MSTDTLDTPAADPAERSAPLVARLVEAHGATWVGQATLADFLALTAELNLRVDACAAFAGAGPARPMNPASALENWRAETCLFMLSRNAATTQGNHPGGELPPVSGDLFDG